MVWTTQVSYPTYGGSCLAESITGFVGIAPSDDVLHYDWHSRSDKIMHSQKTIKAHFRTFIASYICLFILMC